MQHDAIVLPRGLPVNLFRHLPSNTATRFFMRKDFVNTFAHNELTAAGIKEHELDLNFFPIGFMELKVGTSVHGSIGKWRFYRFETNWIAIPESTVKLTVENVIEFGKVFKSQESLNYFAHTLKGETLLSVNQATGPKMERRIESAYTGYKRTVVDMSSRDSKLKVELENAGLHPSKKPIPQVCFPDIIRPKLIVTDVYAECSHWWFVRVKEGWITIPKGIGGIESWTKKEVHERALRFILPSSLKKFVKSISPSEL